MNITKILVKFWQGEITLWKSYWLVGELINALIVIIIFNIELKIFNNTQLFLHMPLLRLSDIHFTNKCIIVVWAIFITVGIWKSAERYPGKFIWTFLTLIILSYRLFILKEIFN